MNQLELEIIILNSAWSMIDSMVNWVIFVNLSPKPCGPSEFRTNLMFKDRAHSEIFLILLRDFLSEVQPHKSEPVPLGLKKAPHNASPSDKTFLFHLRYVCKSPQLGTNVKELSRKVEDFGNWLEGEFTLEKVWLPDIDKEVNICVSRYRYITMCGDITKHHLGRLSYTVDQLQKLLENVGCEIGQKKAFLAIDNFYEWFFEHVFFYHSHPIAEFLNNIRWEIYLYLKNEFKRSIELYPKNSPSDLQRYRYHVPPEINDPLAHAMYWTLMNNVRSKPLMSPDQIIKESRPRY